MRIERDAEHDLLYVSVRDGEAEDTLELFDGVNLDVDDSGLVLGMEFMSMAAFERYLERHDGVLEIPDRLTVPRASQEEVLSTLTPAEREVLKLLAQGKNNREISERLGLSFGTTKRTVTVILRKVGAKTREEAEILLAAG